MPTPRSLLVGFDGSEGARSATRWALGVAAALKDVPVELLAASGLPPIPRTGWHLPVEALLEEQERQLEAAASDFLERGRQTGIEVQLSILRAGAVPLLFERSGSGGDVLLVLGAHAEPRRWSPLGSVSAAVVRKARCPVVVVRGTAWVSPPRRVVWATDGSRAAEAALQAVERWIPAAEITALTVLETGRPGATPAGEEPEPPIAPERSGLQLHRLRGDPEKAILEELERNPPDLVALGRRGLSAWKELLLGSVSHKLLELAPCPVLVAH